METAHLALPAWQPSWRPSSSSRPSRLATAVVTYLLPGVWRSCARRARARAGHLLLPRSLLEAPDDATHSPRPLSLPLPLSSGLPSSLSPFPANARELLLSPLAIAVPTVLPSPLRCFQKNRRAFLFVSTNPRDAGCTAASSPPPSSLHLSGDRRGRFAVSDASPRPPSCSSTSL